MKPTTAKNTRSTSASANRSLITVRPERQRVGFGFLLGPGALQHRGVVVAGGVEGPDMHRDQPDEDEGQEVVQREAVERGVVGRRPAQKPGLDRLADARDRAKQAGDDRGAPERHLPPGQDVAHEGGAHHQKVDDHADDPGHFARSLVAAVEEATEDVDVDRKEEERRPVGVQVAQHVPAVHIAHDVFDAREGQIDMRRVVHRKDDASRDLQYKAERQDDAPDPPPVQVLRRRDHQRVVDQADNRQAPVQPLFDTRLGFVMVVRNTSHGRPPQPSLMVVASTKAAIGTSRLRGAGPLRIRPAVS